MRNEAGWRPSVFVKRGSRWGASTDGAEVAPASRVQAQVAAGAYAEAFARFARGNLLDLGCGKVPCYGMYRPHVTSVTCTDWGRTMHPSSHLDFVCDLTEPLPLRDGVFDTVVLTDVLEHLPNPDTAFGELRRVLRPGGHAIVAVPFMYGVHEAPYDFHRYTEFRLRLFCDTHCFEAVELRPNGDPGAVWADLSLKILAHSPVGRVMVLPLSRVAMATVRRARGRTFTPTGYTLVARAL